MFAGIGPALVDYIHYIDEYPKRGGHAVVKKSVRMAGGAGANVVCGLAKYGVKCRFYSTVGKDEDARFFAESMKGVELKFNVTHEKTGKVDIFVDKDGERTFFVHPNASGIVELKINDEDYKEVDYFYLDPFPSKDSFSVQLSIAKNAKSFGKCVILSLSYPYVVMGFERVKEILKFTDIAITSQPEFELLSVAEDYVLRYVEILVITLGKKGSKVITAEEEHYQPAFKVERVVDTTGAGDAFSVGFLYGYIKGYSLKTCLKLGNYVASYNIQHFGARNYPDLNDLMRLLDDEKE